MLPPFEIHQPRSVKEAIELRARLGDDAAVYAGGSELLLAMKEGMARYPNLIDVKVIPGLAALGWDIAARRLSIGATVTHRQVERSVVVREHFPTLGEMAAGIANVRVRNVGTFGGNVCFAEPHSDIATILLAYGAEMVVEGTGGQRQLPVGDFIVGPYETALGTDEILTRIEVPEPPAPTVGAYLKFGFHERPSVSVAILLTLAEGARIGAARVSVGCVGPTAQRLGPVEERVRGLELGEVGDGRWLSRDAGDLVDAVSDLHGGADYKQHLVEVLTARALATCARRSADR